MRGIDRSLNKHGLWLRRLVVGEGTAPGLAPVYVLPTAAPTAVPAKGDVYFDQTSNQLVYYNGSRWVFDANTLHIEDVQNQVAAASYAVSHTVWVNPSAQTYRLAALSAVFGTASTSGTVNAEVATGTQALAGGVNQLATPISLAGTANTVVNGAIATQTTIPAGGRLNLIFAGTVTNLANCVVTAAIERLS